MNDAPYRVLVADDEPSTRLLIRRHLEQWGYKVLPVPDGEAALDQLEAVEDAPRLAILDWDMPQLDGVEVCKALRALQKGGAPRTYVIVLTGRAEPNCLIEAMEQGADDYLTKPFNKEELRVRVMAGMRVLELEDALRAKNTRLEAALAEVQTLRGLLPICMYCKSVRDPSDYWHEIERYIMQQTDARFSHTICPDCFEKYHGVDGGDSDV